MDKDMQAFDRIAAAIKVAGIKALHMYLIALAFVAYVGYRFIVGPDKLETVEQEEIATPQVKEERVIDPKNIVQVPDISTATLKKRIIACRETGRRGRMCEIFLGGATQELFDRDFMKGSRGKRYEVKIWKPRRRVTTKEINGHFEGDGFFGDTGAYVAWLLSELSNGIPNTATILPPTQRFYSKHALEGPAEDAPYIYTPCDSLGDNDCYMPTVELCKTGW